MGGLADRALFHASHLHFHTFRPDSPQFPCVTRKLWCANIESEKWRLPLMRWKIKCEWVPQNFDVRLDGACIGSGGSRTDILNFKVMCTLRTITRERYCECSGFLLVAFGNGLSVLCSYYLNYSSMVTTITKVVTLWAAPSLFPLLSLRSLVYWRSAPPALVF